MLFIALAITYATTQAVKSAAVEVLLQLATQKVDGVARSVEVTAPIAWTKLLSNSPLTPSDLADLGKSFADEQRELKISFLKIYGRDRKTLYATEASEIGKVEDKPELRSAIESGTASVLVEQDARGGVFYELYLPFRSGGQTAAVFELYEPVSDFDILVWKVMRPVVVIPALLFAILMATLIWLVNRAQSDINLRTNVILSLRRKLESLVSRRAVEAMRTGEEESRPETLEASLLYTDVRGFTGFAECRSPLEVIGFLNRIMGLQVETVEAHGGDVDKMIGDAILARFHGPDRASDAVGAALAIQKAVRAFGFPRGLAIGIFDGPVVAGLIGTAGRYDYTVVGDSVNIAARLCALAKEGEIVADSKVIEASKAGGFGAPELVQVKGRAGALVVRRA